MKRILIFLVLLATQSYGQTIRGVYIHTHLKSMSSDANGVTKNPIEPETFSFSYSDQKSLYEMISSQKSKIDTSHIFHKGVKLETYNAITLADVDVTYKNLKNNQIIKEYNIRNSNFSAKDKLHDYEWTITNETAVINGYKCKKATTKKAFVPTTAWFTEEIPINDGPFEFWDLPGLIIKVELGGYTDITLETITITPENSEIKEPQNKSTQVTLDNFNSSIEAYLEGTSPVNKYK